MIFAASINKLLKVVNNLPLEHKLFFTVLLAGLALRMIAIPNQFPFDHDQSIAAESAYNFVVERRISLIGQELSFPGFYLGPIHNWVSFIPYLVCNLSPACVPYFFTIVGMATACITYLLLGKIFKYPLAFIVASIYSLSFSAVSFEVGVNSNYFLFLSSVLLLFTLHSYYKKNDKYLILGAFIGGLATVNFNPVFIFSVIAFYVAVLFRKKVNYFYLLASVLAFFVNYLPLIIFDLRHEHIFLRNMIAFINQNASGTEIIPRLNFLITKVFIPFNTQYLFSSTNIVFVILFLILFTSGGLHALRSGDTLKKWILSWPFIVLFMFNFYKGHIPDYYVQQSTLATILIVSFAMVQKKLLAISGILLIGALSFAEVISPHSVLNYNLKNNIVNFVLRDTGSETFNVYYNIEGGLNTGYRTLFKLKGREPQENQKNLYLVDYSDSEEFLDLNKRSFRDKSILVTNFNSHVRVISVK